MFARLICLFLRKKGKVSLFGLFIWGKNSGKRNVSWFKLNKVDSFNPQKWKLKKIDGKMKVFPRFTHSLIVVEQQIEACLLAYLCLLTTLNLERSKCYTLLCERILSAFFLTYLRVLLKEVAYFVRFCGRYIRATHTTTFPSHKILKVCVWFPDAKHTD